MNVLAEPGTRKWLLRYAERRLSPADAEDVVQEALCDAMRSALPSDARAQERWLMTIVKRRICDWFRARRQNTPLPEDLGGAAPEEAIVARDLLRRIDCDASTADRRTLGWLVREHDGESLLHIAEAERLEAPSVRQRIRRLRRSLRAHHFAAAVVALLMAGGVAYSRPEAITRDPVELLVGDARGVYRVESVTSRDRALVEALRISRVRVLGSRVVIEGAKTITLDATSVGADSFVLRSGATSETVHLVRRPDGLLVVTSPRGEIHLRRE